jgi:hypothetical protein
LSIGVHDITLSFLGAFDVKTFDFAKTLKDLYTAAPKVKEVAADNGTFFAVDGVGAPGGEAFQQAVQALYNVLYTVKFTLKLAGTLDFKVGKLECLYLSDPKQTPMHQWKWRVLVRVPDEVAAKDLAQAKKAVREKKGIDASQVKRLRWKEGRALQLLHVGPYEAVGSAYERLDAYAKEQGLAIHCAAHEIYLNDPRRTPHAKLKTIVRLPVKRAT